MNMHSPIDWYTLFETFDRAFGKNEHRSMLAEGFITGHMFDDLVTEFSDHEYYTYILTSNLT